MKKNNKEIMEGTKSRKNVWHLLLVAKAFFCMHRPIRKFPFCPCTNQMPLAPRPCKRPHAWFIFLTKATKAAVHLEWTRYLLDTDQPYRPTAHVPKLQLFRFCTSHLPFEERLYKNNIFQAKIAAFHQEIGGL